MLKLNASQFETKDGNRHKGFHKGPWRIIRLCLFSAILPMLLLCIPLYMKFHKFRLMTFLMNPIESLVLSNNISTFWCQGCVVRTNRSIDTYLYSGQPRLSSSKLEFQLNDSIRFKGEMSEYWKFYLQKGSVLRVEVCARWPGSIMMITKGQKNLESCLFLNDDDSMEATPLDKQLLLRKAYGSGPGSGTNSTKHVIYRSSRDRELLFAKSCKNIMARMSKNKDKAKHSGIRFFENICKEVYKSFNPMEKTSQATEGMETTSPDVVYNVLQQQTFSLNDELEAKNITNDAEAILMVENMTANYLERVSLDENVTNPVLTTTQSSDLGSRVNSSFLNFLIHGSASVNELKQNEYKPPKHFLPNVKGKPSRKPSNITGHSKEMFRSVRFNDTDMKDPQDPGSLPLEDSSGEDDDDSAEDMGEVTNKDEDSDDEDFYKLIMEENISSVSSSEEAQEVCMKVKELFASLKPSRYCSKTYNTLWESFTHVVHKDGYYHLIFANDNEIFGNEIHFQLTIHRTVYNLTSSIEACHNSTECHLPLSFLTSRSLLIQKTPVEPLKTVIPHPEQTIEVECVHRTAVYTVFITIIPFLVVSCAYY